MKIWLLIAISTFCLSTLFGETIYTYDKETQGQITEKTFIVKENEGAIKVEGISSRGKADCTYKTDFTLEKMTFNSNDGDWTYAFSRDGGQLYTKCYYRGQARSKKYRINNKVWIQEFDFGLKSFIQSSHRKLYFTTLDPKKLDRHDMVVTKERIEHIRIGETTRPAQKVIITLKGFKSMFWKAMAWYDPETGEMVRYQANEGPSTPINTITFRQKEVKAS